MNITLAAGPLVSLIAGVLILIVPRLLNYIVALYLIVIGLLGLFGGSNYRVGGNAMATPDASVAAVVSSRMEPSATISRAIYRAPEAPVSLPASSGVHSPQM